MTPNSDYCCGKAGTASYNGFRVTALSWKVFKWFALSPFPVRKPGFDGNTSIHPEAREIGGGEGDT